jgi:hypothetical protein
MRTQWLAAPSLFDVLAKHLGGPPSDFVIGVRLGPPRANRKPVLAITDRDGRLVAFAKYGVDSLTDRLISNEAAALAELAGVGELGAGDSTTLAALVVPRLIASGEHEGRQYILQTPVPTRHRRPTPAAVVAAQVEVAQLPGPAVARATALSALRDDWRRRASSGDAIAQEFAAAAAVWCESVDVMDVPWGSWHGDWRATNMGAASTRCSVWDWERFTRGVPLGYDALHLFLTSRQSSVHDLSTLPDDVRDNAPRLLRPFGISRRDVSDVVTTGYLLELAGRYLDDKQDRAGARLGAVGEWLLPHAQQALSADRATRGVTRP